MTEQIGEARILKMKNGFNLKKKKKKKTRPLLKGV